MISNEWSGRWDSNPRRLAWEASTLPLSYTRSRRQTQYLLYYTGHGKAKALVGATRVFGGSLSPPGEGRAEGVSPTLPGKMDDSLACVPRAGAIVTHPLRKGARLCAPAPGNHLNGNAIQAAFALPFQLCHPVGMHPGPVRGPLLAGGPLRLARHVRWRYHRQRPLYVQQHV